MGDSIGSMIGLLALGVATGGAGLAAGGAAAAAGGAASTASTISAIAGIASAGMSVISGIGQQQAADYQAKIETLNARREAVAVNDNLIKTLAMNNAAAAAGGLQSSGSVAEANSASQANAADELSVIKFNADARSSALKAQGKQALISGVGQGVLTGAGVLSDAFKRSSAVKKTG